MSAEAFEPPTVELQAVLSDDQLITALAGGLHLFTTDELTKMLQAWRDECRDAQDPSRTWLAASKLAAMRAGISTALSRYGMDRITIERRPT